LGRGLHGHYGYGKYRFRHGYRYGLGFRLGRGLYGHYGYGRYRYYRYPYGLYFYRSYRTSPYYDDAYSNNYLDHRGSTDSSTSGQNLKRLIDKETQSN
jgi:hypothetical protein